MGEHAVVTGNLNLVHCLRGQGIRVVVASSRANRVACFSRFVEKTIEVPGPTRTPQAFVKALLSLGRDLAPLRPVLFYDGDADLLCISRNRDELGRYFRFNLPPASLVETLLDKSAFARFALERALPVPRTYAVIRHGEANEIATDIRYPVLIKPLSRVGWFGTDLSKFLAKGGKAFHAMGAGEMEQILAVCKARKADMLVQQLVRGTETSIESYHSYGGVGGEIIGEFTGKKHRTYPEQYGLSVNIEVCDLPNVKELGRRIVKAIGLTGVSKIDFKRDSDSGELYLLEINPRFSIWNYPGAVAGVNLPLLALCDLTGTKPPATVSRVNPVRWVDGALNRRAIAVVSSSVKEYWGLCWKEMLGYRVVYNIWSWKDPGPFLYSGMQSVVRMLRKLSGFVRSALSVASKVATEKFMRSPDRSLNSLPRSAEDEAVS